MTSTMIEKNIKYFSNGFVSVMQTQDGRLIETTSTCLPIGTEIRMTGKTDNKIDPNDFQIDNWKDKWTVGVSTQSGCPIKCKFCAVNRVTEKFGWRNLTSDEMVEQVEYAIKRAQEINGGIDPKESKIFRVLFTRMGEPALNISSVVAAIMKIKVKYPFARIQISTIGISKSGELVRALMDLEKIFGYDWLELQFSIHSTDNKYRRWLQTNSVMENEKIAKLASTWYYSTKNRPWKATLNFALAKETVFNPTDLSVFDPNTVFVKISPVNENPVSDENGLKTMFKYENSI